MKANRLSLMLGLTLATGAIVSAQRLGPVEPIRTQDGRWAIRNDLPVPIALLLVGTQSDESRVYSALRVERMSVKDVPFSRSVDRTDLIAVEAISDRAKKTETDSCQGIGLDLSVFREIDNQLVAAQISESAGARGAVAARRKVGDLEADNWWEWRLHELSDPYREEYIKFLVDTNSPQAQVELANDQAELQHGPGLAATMASAYEMRERREQWNQEGTLLEPFVAKLGELRRTVEKQVRDVAALAKASKEFGRLTLEAVGRESARRGGPLEASRLCGQHAASNKDEAVVTESTPAREPRPLAMEFRFNDGTRATYTAFPSRNGPARWIVTFFWPPAARTAEIRDSHGSVVGRIDSGREDLQSSLDRLAKAEASARKKLKQAKWFSKGGAQNSNGVVIQ